MAFANAAPLPRSKSNHAFSSMLNSLSHGYNLSISSGQYKPLTSGYLMNGMQTVFETRRTRLGMLVKQHGSVAKLNRALGWEETNARLYQIHNKSVRADRGTMYELGDTTAREIEEKLKLPIGWMDTPPTYAELDGDNDPRAMIQHMVQEMPPEDWPTALRLLSALKKPEAKNGTSG
jgi:hypothetical protein